MSQETFQAPELDQLAKMLPNFDFQAFIAKGGMGAVYKARQRSLDRDVAIKILPRELGADPEFRKSFETEAKAMARLNDPNLISVYDFGDVDGMPYIVMEYVDGKSLYHSAWNKVVEPKQAVAIVAAICRGLGHAHENGVIHRDIKPANILLTPKAEPKIGDFGLARPADHDGPGLVMGTPGYSAPELMEDHGKADKRADLYAVGVILHELLTGQRPDPEGKETRKATGITKLDAIWKKATQADPESRYQSAEELADDLDTWARNPASHAASKLVTSAPGSPAAAGDPARPQPQLAPLKTGSNWTVVRNLLIIAGLVIAIAFTYKKLQVVRAEKAAENERIAKENFENQKRAEAKKQQLIEEAKREAARQQNLPTAPVIPEPEPETPMESLERLRRDLAQGGRAEMPIGAARQGDSDFFIVSKELSWHEAAAFAEDHGGHLATIGSQDDIHWLSQRLPDDMVVWVGAGRSTGDQWISIDGSDWKLDKNPSGVGDYGTLDDLGLLRARRASDRYPFVIEWKRDGSNPATLASMLRRTRETLATPNPVFPPGTRSQDARHFAIIPRELPLHEALRLAEQAGGHLAVPATAEEADWLSDQIEKIRADRGFWLGGTREGSIWKWSTGEPWEFARWNEDADVGSGGEAMVLVPKKGWMNAEPDDEASGLIIEWSNDTESSEAKPREIAATGGDTGNLRAKAAELIEQAIKERDDKLSANVRTFNWDLDVWFRGLARADIDRWAMQVQNLKTLVNGNRVPSPNDIENADGQLLSEQMSKVCTFCYNKQQEIDWNHEAKLKKIREAYVSRLQEAGQAALEKGQRAVADQIKSAIEETEDLEDWVDGMTD